MKNKMIHRKKKCDKKLKGHLGGKKTVIILLILVSVFAILMKHDEQKVFEYHITQIVNYG